MNITTDEMYAALSRSGYLLESEIAKKLSEWGFFVETNLVIEDPFTGKSREIDIVADYYNFEKMQNHSQTCAKIEFIFEIKNNIYPLVLLNEFDFNPRIEDYLGLKSIVTCPKNIKYNNYFVYHDKFVTDNKNHIFTQYCSFQKKNKNDDLMAFHPDNVHSSLSKIIQYCEEKIEDWESRNGDDNEEEFLRHFLYMPILLIQDDLFELKNNTLTKVDSSTLVINYHHKKVPSMAYVFVVTKDGLSQFIENSLLIENLVWDNLNSCSTQKIV